MKIQQLFCLVGFFLFSQILNAQNETELDSLKSLLNSNLGKADRAKINLAISKSSLSTDGIQYAEKAFALFTELKDSSSMSLALEEISAHLRKMGNTDRAIEELMKALKINEITKKKKNIAVISTQIGTLYLNEKEINSGLLFLKKGYKILLELHDSVNVALTCINIGEAYRMADSLDIAEYYFNKSLELNQHLKKKIIAGYNIGNLGLIHSKQGKNRQAIDELKKSIEILSPLEDYYSISVYQSEIGKIFISEGDVTEGENLLKQSLELAKKQKIKEQICEISRYLSEYYESQKMFIQALVFRKQYETYHDSIVNSDNIRKIDQLHAQYQLEKKQADIDILELTNKEKKKEIYFLFTSLLILMVLFIFLFSVWQLKRKAYNTLQKQKTIIEKSEQEKSLLLRELNHRVKNNLQMVSSLLSLQAFELKGHPAAEALKISKYRIEALLLIHQKLYNNNLHSEINLKEYIEELARGLVFNFGKKVNLDLSVSQIITPFEQAIHIGLIINELVTNSLKYAYGNTENPNLQINAFESDNTIQLIVADNGSGITDTDFDKSQSLGIKLVRSLIEQLNGDYWLENSNGCKWNINLRPNLH